MCFPTRWLTILRKMNICLGKKTFNIMVTKTTLFREQVIDLGKNKPMPNLVFSF